MTLFELKNKIEELINKGYGYEHLNVYIAVKDKKAAPMKHSFIPVTNVSVGDPGGWGNTLICVETSEELEISKSK